jgi:hypothetical protein
MPRSRCEVLGQRLVVRIGGVRLHDRDHDVLGHEAGDVVDVPVGVVADDAVAQPQHLADAEQQPQALLDLGARQAGVAVLVQQALLGGQHRAGAVDVDRAALEDQPAREAGTPSAAAIWPGMALSRSHGGYLPPQALKPQSTAASRPASSRTKIAP